MESDSSDIPIEDVRAYWDRRPCNIRHSDKPVGTREYFDEVEARKYKVEPHIVTFVEFSQWQGKRVLEIGCGIGTDTINLARAGARVTATELSEESLKLCKQRFEVFDLDASFYVADAEQLSAVVPVETYDLIYSFGVIHHSPHPELIIEEIKKYMGPDSELRIMLYSKYSTKNFRIWLGKRFFVNYPDEFRVRLGLMNPEAQIGCLIANTYSAREVRELLKGFEVTSIEQDHIFPYHIPSYKRYEYKKVFPWNILPRPIARWIERRLGWHMLIKARLAQ